MPATYDSIATTTLGSAASSITFSSISSAYTDLRLVFVGRADTGTSTQVDVTFNSSTTGYSYTYLWGNGGSSGSNRGQSQSNLRLNLYQFLSSTTPSMFTLDVFSYSGSTSKTSLVTGQQDTSAGGAVYSSVYLWQNSSAINTLTISAAVNNFNAGTTATLYGILRA